MQSKLKFFSILVIIGVMCIAPTVFGAKEMFVDYVIAGTTGKGTENNPIIVDTYSELKKALEHNDIQYITLESVEEVMPKIKNDSGAPMMALTAISIKGNKHLYLKGDAVFTSPATGVTNGVDDGYRSYGNFISVNNGNKLYIDGTGSLKYRNCNIGEVNAVINNNGGSIVIHDGTIEGSYNTRAFCYCINQTSGTIEITGGTFIGTQAEENASADMMAVWIYGGTATISGGEYYSKVVQNNATGYGLCVRGNSNVQLYGGTYRGIIFEYYPQGETLQNLLAQNCVYMKAGKKYDASSIQPNYSSLKTVDTLTVATTKNVIKNISLKIYEPTAGSKPQKPISDTDYVEVRDYTWSTGNNTNFEANTSTTLEVLLKPMNEFIFDSYPNLYINGEKATITEHSAESIICKMNYDVKTEDKTVFVINTSVDIPTEGKELGTPITSTSTVTQTDFEWSPSGQVVVGKTYRLTVLVHKTAGYKFTRNTQPRIGANDAIVDAYQDDYIKYHWDFVAKAGSTTAQPITTPTEQPTEQPIEQPIETPTETPIEQPIQIPIEIPTEQPAEKYWSNASEWAVTELDKASEGNLIPWIFEKQDLTVNITRREFAYVAVKLYEKITNIKLVESKENPFTDTEDIEVLKAYNIGITNGTSDTTFTPDALITREQMATMMTRALNKAKINTTVNLEKVSKFADDGEMHDWGKASIYYMSSIEIIKGIGNNTFNVLGNATREQALLISERSAEKFAK